MVLTVWSECLCTVFSYCCASACGPPSMVGASPRLRFQLNIVMTTLTELRSTKPIEAFTLRAAVSTPGDVASVDQLCRTWKRRRWQRNRASPWFCRWGRRRTSVFKFTSIYLHDTLNRSVYIWMFYIPHSLSQMSLRGGEELGAQPRAPSVVVLSECSDLPTLFPVFELNIAGSLTSVKPTTTVGVCSLALLRRQAQFHG